MVRRVNLLPSNRFLGAAFCVLFTAAFLSAQSTPSIHTGPITRPPFVVTSSLSLSLAPTSVAAGDLNGDGKLDLVITKKNSGNVTVLLGNGNGGFATGVDYPAAKLAGNVVVADLNGDGRPDVAVTDSTTGAVDVLIGNGDGTLRAPVTYAAQSNPLALALGNFTGKGKIDLAVLGSNGLSVLLNDGNGHFTSAASISLSGHPQSFTASDLRSAGRDDLVLANQNGTVTVLLGDGTGNFSAQPAFSVAAGSLSAIVVGDFNGDGKPDLAIAATGANTIAVLLGHGDGSFAPAVAYAVGNGPASLIAADLRSNGITDLVSVNQAANTFSVLLGNGDGTFRPSADFVAGNTPIALAAGDFNNDGHADLAIANNASASIAVPLGRGDGTFVASRVYRADLERKAIASGDLNGDGHPDLVVTNFCGSDPSCSSPGTATVFLAQLDGTYKATSTITLGNGPVAVTLADLNGDKKLDLLALNEIDKTLMVMLGNGDGTFGSPQLYSLSANPRALYVADFNGDGKPDLAIASDCGQTTCSQPGTLDIWLGRGDGSLAASASYTVGYSPVSIAAGDLRGTGHLDLVVANACGDTSSCTGDGSGTLLANDGTGKFTQMGEVDLGQSPSSIALGNLSGGLDLAVALRTTNQIAVLHANGSGGFGAPVTYSVGTAPSALTIADFDGDGNQDVAVANFQSSTVSVLYGTGAGALSAATTYPVSSGPDALVAVTPVQGGISTLVTTNGDTGATPMGNGITALGGSDPGTTASTTSLVVTTTGQPFALNSAVTLTATVVGTTSSPTGSVTFTSTNGTNTQTINDCNGTAGPVSVTAGTSPNSTAACETHELQAGTDSLVAYYSGDSTYEASNSASTSVTAQVNQGTTSLTVVSSSTDNTSSVGQAVTYTASVTPFNEPVALSGSVAFTDNSNPLTCSPAVNDDATGTFTCTTTYTTPGTHAISATYNGSGSDSNYSSSSGSLSPSQTVTTGVTTTSVSTSGSPSSLNASVTFTATLTLPSGATTPPGGSYAFTDNGNAISGCGTQGLTSLQATCATTTLTGGSHTIVATYSGDGNYASSSGSVNQTVTVGSGGSSISLNPSPNPSTVGQQVTFTATVSPSGPFAPTGTVTITGCGSLGISATAPYQATCTTTFTAAGSNSITAAYSGDSNYASSSVGVTQTVNQGTTTTALTSSLNPSSVGQQVVFTATIALPSGATIAPGGTFNFTNNGTTISGCGTASISATSPYVATCTTSFVTTGSNPITATYSGDANYAPPTTASQLTQTVDAGATSVVVTASPSTPGVNQPVTFTATVTLPSGATTTPGGTISFTDNGTAISSCSNLNIASSSPYIAQCSIPSLSSGGHTIAATYSGDSNYLTSLGNLNISLTSASTTTTITASPNPSVVNQAVTFTVSVQGGTTVQLTGTATVMADNTTSLGECTLSGWSSSTGIATCTVSYSMLSTGSHSIVASYSGDANYNSSTSPNSPPELPPLQQTVNTDSTSLTLTASPSSSSVNQTVTFTATIAFQSGNTPLTGTVAFTDNTVSIPGCSAVAPSSTGVATCTDSALTAAGSPHTISASYTGDSNFGASSMTLSPAQTVGEATTSIAVTSSQPSSAVNASVTFTATLTYPAGGVPLTGSVAFTDSVTTAAIPGCSTQALAVNGSTGTAAATCTTSTLAFGSHNITATYTDTANNFLTSMNSVTQSVGVAPISMTLSAPATSGIVNQATPLVFDANITAPSGTTSLTGTVAFTDNGTVIPACSAVAPSANGTGSGTTLWLAPCSDPALTAASSPHTIAATYSGDKNFGNTNAALTTPITITPAATSIAVTTSPNPSSFNQSVTFTAAVSAPSGGVALSGKVSFTDSATTAAITGCSGLSPLANGVATCTYSGLAIGAHTITAAYGSDLNFSASNNTTTQTVGTATTSVSVTSSLNPSVVNQAVVFTATVSSAAQGSTPFSGTMSFVAGASAITGCTGLTVTGGVAQCSTASLPVGTTIITATYANDPSFGGSSGTVAQTVNQSSAYTLVLGAKPSAALIESGQSVTFTAAITPAYTGSLALNGNMVFTDTYTAPSGATSSVTLCSWPAGSANFTSSGVATCTYALPDGSNSIVASYTGDTKLTAVSTAVVQTIDDFSVSIAPVPENSLGVEITQGFKSTTDPYPSQPLVATPQSVAGYTGTVTLTCAPTPASSSAPACSLGTGSLAVVTTGVQQSTGITLDATNATPGTYTFAVTATDANGLTHTYTFPVTVRALSTSLSVVSGATTNNTTTVSFVLPAGVSLPLVNSTSSNTGSCASVVGPELSSTSTPLSLSIGCSFNPSQVPSSASQQTAMVTVTISTGSTVAMTQPSGRSGLLIAGIFGLPFVGLLGLLRGRKSARTIFLRLLAILALSAAGWQIMGCGGSFSGSTSTSGGQTPPGVYNILVQATGSDNNTYQAVIQLNVKL